MYGKRVFLKVNCYYNNIIEYRNSFKKNILFFVTHAYFNYVCKFESFIFEFSINSRVILISKYLETISARVPIHNSGFVAIYFALLNSRY